MVSSLLSWNMNMAEWERDAAAQGQSESAKEEDNESHDEGQQWRAGYLAAPQQPYPDHHYVYGSYNTPITAAPASAISDDAGTISFPRYQAFASFPYHHGIQTAGDTKLDGPDVKSADSDHEEKKPAAAALPVHGVQLDRSERHRSSFDDSDDETAEWIEGYDPMLAQRGGPVVPAYAPPPPSHFVPHHASMPRDVVAMHPPDRHHQHDLHHQHHHVEHEARYNNEHHHYRSSSRRVGSGQHHHIVGNNHHRAPSDEELRESQTPRSKLALKSWYDRFNELIEYMAVHGDCNVPQKYEENPKLGVWVNKQRMEKKFLDDGKRSSMTLIKQQNLESIGFQWAKRKGNVSWEIKYRELKEYRQRHGHCNVPTKYSQNPALGRWVSTQRSEFKKFQSGRSKHMSHDKVDKLTAIGFKWEMLQQQRSSESDNDSLTDDRETEEGL